MEIRVLGPVEADGEPVAGREAAVLAALALRAPRAATADELIDAVWGSEPPITAPKALQNAVSKLRRRLGASTIVTVGRGYRLDASVDVREVERLAAAGEPDAALALWRGEPVAVGDAERAHLSQLRAMLEDEAARAAIDRGEPGRAVAELERLVVEDPYREPRWVLLVRALAAAGRQADALRAAQRARRVLAENLGLEPGPELVRAERAVFDAPAAPARRSLPRPTTSFVGRDDDVRAARDALDAHRIVTLVGPGGVGKTRLAVVAVGDRDVVFVDLAAARSDSVWEALAAAAAVATDPRRSVAETVVEALADSLVVLDSCEHLLDAAAEVADLLGCPILATSREPLGLPDETVIAVQPLARGDALELFADRAGVADDRAAVDRLCERLDDLPLAIELAAARSPVLGAAQIVERLDDRFTLLDGRTRRGHVRQRGLGAMVDWSYELLEEDEQLLFQRLSVFRSSFALEDAEAVAGDDALPAAAIAPALTRLVHASMVTVDAERRLRLLDTFRAYAAARLDDPQRWRRRHLDWVSSLSAEAASQLVGPDQVLWFDRVSQMLDDVQWALAWCRDNGPARVGLQIAGDLFHFWMGRARRHEGLSWVRTFAHGADDVPALERCRAIYGAGMIAMMQDLPSVGEMATLACEIADDRDSRAVADALSAIVPLWADDIDTAEQLASSCMPVLDEPQHEGSLARLWDLRAWIATRRGDLDLARHYHGRRIAELTTLEDRHLKGAWLSIDGDLAYAQERNDEADALGAQALTIARAVSCPSCESSALTTLSLVRPDPLDLLVPSYALVLGIGEAVGLSMTLGPLAAACSDIDPRVAAQVAGARAAHNAEQGIRYEMPGRAAFTTPALAAARRRLGEDEWSARMADGRRLGLDGVLSLVSAL